MLYLNTESRFSAIFTLLVNLFKFQSNQKGNKLGVFLLEELVDHIDAVSSLVQKKICLNLSYTFEKKYSVYILFHKA